MNGHDFVVFRLSQRAFVVLLLGLLLRKNSGLLSVCRSWRVILHRDYLLFFGEEHRHVFCGQCKIHGDAELSQWHQYTTLNITLITSLFPVRIIGPYHLVLKFTQSCYRRWATKKRKPPHGEWGGFYQASFSSWSGPGYSMIPTGDDRQDAVASSVGDLDGYSVSLSNCSEYSNILLKPW